MTTHQTTHKHPNTNTEWIFARCGEDGNRDWKWTCINPDGSSTIYPANAHMWISMDTPPLMIGTLATTYEPKSKYQRIDWWWTCGINKITWAHSHNASHWMPQMQSPEVKS